MSLETVRVCVRMAPSSSDEEHHSERIIELLKDNKLIAYHPESKQGLMYQFDSTFGHDVPNIDIYGSACEDTVRHFLTGFNVCYLSYGPSKTGKTQLFFGTPDELGIISLTVKEIFNHAFADRNDFRYEIFLQFWEMNNSDIVDLLQPMGGQEQRKFKIHKDPQNREKAIKNLTKRSLDSYEHFERVMKAGTLFSQEISLHRGIRWHNFLKITVSRTDITQPHHTIQSSAFFVNLKGTDRLGQYGANKQLVKEGASINRSITAFGNTIHNLVSFCRKRFRKGENLPRNITKLRQSLQKETHSMFGDSKMTLMLSDIFVGNYYTTILCSVSGSEFHYLETVDALENLRIANHIPVFPEKGVVRNTEIFQVHKEIMKIERNLEKDPLAPGHPPTEQQERLFELRKEFVVLCEEEGLSASYMDDSDDDDDEVVEEEEDASSRNKKKKRRRKKKKKTSENLMPHGFEFGQFPHESERSKQTFFMPKKKRRKKKKVGSIEMFKEMTKRVESQGGSADHNTHPNMRRGKNQKRKKLYQYVYEGSWDQGNKNGFGIIETNKYKYEGFWKQNKKHGEIGVLSIKEEVKVPIRNPKTMLSKKFRKKTVYRRVYKGEWKFGKKHGRGIYYFRNGEMYIGEWENDQKHGSGIMYKLDGSKHTGVYAYDMKNGYGVTEYRNGNLFRGYFTKDHKHGPGIYYYRDQNQVYKGEWAEGVPKCGEIGYLDEVVPGKEEPTHVLSKLPLPVSKVDDRVAMINEAVVKTRKSSKGVIVEGSSTSIGTGIGTEGEESFEELDLDSLMGVPTRSMKKKKKKKTPPAVVFEKEMDFLVDDYERLLFPSGRDSYQKSYEERLRKIRKIEERRRRKAGEKMMTPAEEEEEGTRMKKREDVDEYDPSSYAATTDEGLIAETEGDYLDEEDLLEEEGEIMTESYVDDDGRGMEDLTPPSSRSGMGREGEGEEYDDDEEEEGEYNEGHDEYEEAIYDLGGNEEEGEYDDDDDDGGEEEGEVYYE